MKIMDWNIEEMTGYKPLTTFYSDFSIADNFGVNAIRETYQNAREYWCDDYRYLTEIVMVLNWKAWEHSQRADYCDLYIKLFQELQDYAFDTLKGEELEYFIRTTD